MESEIWKDIPEYEGLYQASNLGRVRSLDRVSIGVRFNSTRKGRILKGRPVRHGYLAIVLYGKDLSLKNIAIHRVVAITFLDNPENKPCVNHKNLIKTDNRLENLEWCTHQENMKHAGKNGVMGGTKGMFIGSKSVRSKVKEEDVLEIRRLHKEDGLNSVQINKIFPALGRRHITDILNRVYWTHI